MAEPNEPETDDWIKAFAEFNDLPELDAFADMTFENNEDDDSPEALVPEPA